MQLLQHPLQLTSGLHVAILSTALVCYSCCSRIRSAAISPSVASEVVLGRSCALLRRTSQYRWFALVYRRGLAGCRSWRGCATRRWPARSSSTYRLLLPLSHAACACTWLAEALPQTNKHTNGRDGVIGIAQGGMSDATVVQQTGLHDTRRCPLCRCMCTAHMAPP